MAAFLRGAGLDPQRIGSLGEGELEEMGRLVRLALLGLLELHASKAELKRDLRAEDQHHGRSQGQQPPEGRLAR